MFEKFNNRKFTLLKNLQSIYGIGYLRAFNFHKKIGINLRLSSIYIIKFQKKFINYHLKIMLIDHKLKQYLKNIHEFAYNIRSRKGVRNKIGLPSRGQQTRTNAKTKKKIKIKF